MPIESVAFIFERINSTGTRLTIVGLMRADTWREELDLIDTIDGEVLEAISEKGFGGVDRKAVLRNLFASAGGGFSVDSIDHLRNKSPDDLKTAAEATVEAYKMAVDFLKQEIGATGDAIMPYANQLVVLAETVSIDAASHGTTIRVIETLVRENDTFRLLQRLEYWPNERRSRCDQEVRGWTQR